jgi:dihydroflavonol-4-reductase
MPDVLVTGITGFIGSHVAHSFLQRGYSVRGMVRPSQSLSWHHPSLSLAYGDITNIDSVRSAVTGCKYVVHIAALYKFWSLDPELIFRVNMDGTRNIIQCALAAGVERIVYTSTISTLKPKSHGEKITEHDLATKSDMAGSYKLSKFEAEKIVRRFMLQGAPIVVVHPTAPVGPADVKPTPTGRIILDFLRTSIPAYIDTGLNLVSIDDVAEGHVLALEKGIPGQHYILGNIEGNLSLIDIFRSLESITGRPAPRLRLPYWIALGAAYVDDFVENILLKHEPRIPLEGTKMARTPMWVDCSKAVIELGIPQTSVYQSLESAVRWYQENRAIDV